MSLYSQYVKERENGEVLELPDGFAVYFLLGEECYIRDIFVTKKCRKDHLASYMANEITKIAKSKNCTYLSGSVDNQANKSDESKKVLTAYGFKYVLSRGSVDYYKKEIQ